MASFLRKFVKAKSRSKSPTKPLSAGGAEFRQGDDCFRLFDENQHGYGPHESYMGHMGNTIDGRPLFEPSSSAAPPYSVGMPRKSASYRHVAVPPLLSEYSHGGAMNLGDGILPYSTHQRRFLDAEKLSAPDGIGPPLGNVSDRLSRCDTRHSPTRRKSPLHSSTRKCVSPTRPTIPNSGVATLVALSSSSQLPYSNVTASPMLSSQPQYYFTPDYKVYEDVASENELRVPGTPQQPYSPLPSGHSNTTTTYYQEPGPSSSNTLTPAWHGTDHRRPFSATLRPTSMEYMNGGVVGLPHSGGAPPPPTLTGSRDVAYGTFHAFNGCLSSATGSAGASYMPGGAPLSAATVRPRSTSPRKALKGDSIEERKFRSRSPTKRLSTRSSITKTLDYLQPQCRLEGCSAVIIVEDTQFLACKHQMSHASEFFRTLFLNNRALPVEGVRQTAANEYTIVVSGLRHPPQSVQFQWFMESTVLCPILKPIADNSLETCMRLSKRFAAKGLELRCAKFIQENVEDKPPMMALCWLNWAFKHRFDRQTLDACAPVVARLPLIALERHRHMLPERAVAALIAAKLRVCYQQSAKVFYTIHRMDHFYVDMERCPRCGRQREQGKVRVQANPCHKLIGCERCLQGFDCAIESKAGSDFEAFHQCEHGALQPFNDRAEDCSCQTPLYRLGYGGSSATAYGSVVSAEECGDASPRRTTVFTAPIGRPSTSGSKSN